MGDYKKQFNEKIDYVAEYRKVLEESKPKQSKTIIEVNRKNIGFEFCGINAQLNNLLQYCHENQNTYWIDKITPVRDLMEEMIRRGYEG